MCLKFYFIFIFMDDFFYVDSLTDYVCLGLFLTLSQFVVLYGVWIENSKGLAIDSNLMINNFILLNLKISLKYWNSLQDLRIKTTISAGV